MCSSSSVQNGFGRFDDVDSVSSAAGGGDDDVGDDDA